MPRKPRIWYPGAIYHVMSRGNRRTNIFKEPEDYIQFLEFLKIIQSTFPFKIHAICLMTNHFHFQIETKDVELWKIMQRILTLYAGYFNNKYSYNGHLFQGRYVSCLIETDQYFLEVSRYIHLNPVKAKMVTQPQEYIYSSYACYHPKALSSSLFKGTLSLYSSILDTSRTLAYFRGDKSKYEQFVKDGLNKNNEDEQIRKDIREDEFGEPLESA